MPNDNVPINPEVERYVKERTRVPSFYVSPSPATLVDELKQLKSRAQRTDTGNYNLPDIGRAGTEGALIGSTFGTIPAIAGAGLGIANEGVHQLFHRHRSNQSRRDIDDNQLNDQVRQALDKNKNNTLQTALGVASTAGAGVVGARPISMALNLGSDYLRKKTFHKLEEMPDEQSLELMDRYGLGSIEDESHPRGWRPQLHVDVKNPVTAATGKGSRYTPAQQPLSESEIHLNKQFETAGLKTRYKSPEHGVIELPNAEDVRPGVLAHELGHAQMQREKSIPGFFQRHGRKLRLGATPAAPLATAYATKDDDSILAGAAKGGLIGGALHAPTLIPELTSTYRAHKNLHNLPGLSPQMKSKNMKGLGFAALPYLIDSVGVNAGVGGLSALFHKLTKNKTKSEQQPPIPPNVIKQSFHKGVLKRASERSGIPIEKLAEGLQDLFGTPNPNQDPYNSLYQDADYYKNAPKADLSFGDPEQARHQALDSNLPGYAADTAISHPQEALGLASLYPRVRSMLPTQVSSYLPSAEQISAKVAPYTEGALGMAQKAMPWASRLSGVTAPAAKVAPYLGGGLLTPILATAGAAGSGLENLEGYDTTKNFENQLNTNVLPNEKNWGYLGNAATISNPLNWADGTSSMLGKSEGDFDVSHISDQYQNGTLFSNALKNMNSTLTNPFGSVMKGIRQNVPNVTGPIINSIYGKPRTPAPAPAPQQPIAPPRNNQPIANNTVPSVTPKPLPKPLTLGMPRTNNIGPVAMGTPFKPMPVTKPTLGRAGLGIGSGINNMKFGEFSLKPLLPLVDDVASAVLKPSVVPPANQDEENKKAPPQKVAGWDLHWSDLWDTLFGIKHPISENAEISRIPVQSSNIQSIGHDPTSRTLEVQFKNGGLYRYPNIKNWQYEAFRTAPSKGKYFAKHIKPEKDFKKISV